MTTPRTRPTNHAAPYDLLIRGAEVLDPSQGLHGARDVAFAWGRVAAVAEPGTIDPDAARGVIEAAGMLVTPGLIDLHTHIYVGGSELVIPADEVCSVSGCTTVVDAGTAGANTMLGLRRLAQTDIRTRAYAFVHISGIGLAGHPHGELRDLLYLDPELAARCVLSHRGFVLGVKVRQTAGPGRGERPRAVAPGGARRRAGAGRRSARDGVERVPVMVHYGSAPASLAELLAVLRPGDVVTHGYNGGTNGVLGRRRSGGAPPRARRASGGSSGTSATAGGASPTAVAEGLRRAGLLAGHHLHRPAQRQRQRPGDRHAHHHVQVPQPGHVPAGRGRAQHERPRRVHQPGPAAGGPRAPAGDAAARRSGDAAVLDLRRAGGAGGEHTFQDSLGLTWTGRERLIPVHTVLGGRPWGRPYPHPYLVP